MLPAKAVQCVTWSDTKSHRIALLCSAAATRHPGPSSTYLQFRELLSNEKNATDQIANPTPFQRMANTAKILLTRVSWSRRMSECFCGHANSVCSDLFYQIFVRILVFVILVTTVVAITRCWCFSVLKSMPPTTNLSNFTFMLIVFVSNYFTKYLFAFLFFCVHVFETVFAVWDLKFITWRIFIPSEDDFYTVHCVFRAVSSIVYIDLQYPSSSIQLLSHGELSTADKAALRLACIDAD